MDFKTYYLGLGQLDRKAFADKVGTSTGYCHQLVYGSKQVELGLADAMVAASAGALTLDELPLTDRAKFQMEARKWDGKERRGAGDKPAAKSRAPRKEARA